MRRELALIFSLTYLHADHASAPGVLSFSNLFSLKTTDCGNLHRVGALSVWWINLYFPCAVRHKSYSGKNSCKDITLLENPKTIKTERYRVRTSICKSSTLLLERLARNRPY